jgi:hypothetical protein
MSEIKFSLTFDKLDGVQVKKAFDVLMVWYNNDRELVLEKMKYPAIAEANAYDWQIELQKNVNVIPEWNELGAYYIEGSRVRYNNIVYNVVQSITVTDLNHTPDITQAHYRKAPVIYPDQRYPRWDSKGLLDSVNHWKLGERVEWNGEEYESNFNGANVWEPGATGITQWTKLQEEPPVGNACEGVPLWSAGQHWQTYTIGDKRVDGGKLYQCHDPQWAQSYAPSSSWGYLAWTYLQDCN